MIIGYSVLDRNQIPIPESTVASRMLNTAQPEKMQAVLVLPISGKVKVLNEVGARIWSLVDGKRSIAQIAEQIFLEYDIDKEQALADAMDFLTDLVKSGAIKLGDFHS